MNLPLQFPDYTEEIYRDAKAFQALPATQRDALMRSLIDTAFWQIRESPNRQRIEEMIEDSERLWQQRQREAFAKYAPTHH